MGAVPQWVKSPCAQAFCVLLTLLVATLSARGQTPQALRSASAIAYDATGNLYIADALGNQVVEATLAGDLVVVAGTGTQGFAGDGGPAVSAELDGPRGLAVGADGSLYIADTGNDRVRVVAPGGLISTVLGTGVAGRSGDGGSPLAAQVRGPTALTLQSSGGLLICDTGNNQLRRVVGNVVTTVAGTGLQGFVGDGQDATLAALNGPAGVAVAKDGTVFLADTGNNRVRSIGATGTINTVAGSAKAGYEGDGGSALNAMLSGPRGLALAADGTLLIADVGNQRVRSISPAGLISTLAGTGNEGSSAEGTRALSASLQSPRSVAVSPLGYVALADTLRGTARAVAGGAALYQPAALQGGRTTKVTAATSLAWTYGQSSLAATVQGAVAAPLGWVRLTENGTLLQQANVSAGTVNLDVSNLSAGQHNLLLHYLGDGLNPASSSSILPVTVNPVSLTAIADPAVMTYGAPLPTFAGVLSGVLAQDATRVRASFGVETGELPPVGSYSIVASLSGSGASNYTVAMSPASGRLQVARARATEALQDPGPGYVGIPLTVQATVSPPGRGQPTGMVQFLDGSTVFATSQLNRGTASGLYPAPPSGGLSLSVQYLGDANFSPGSSGATLVTMAPMPDFNIVATGANSASTAAGGSVTYTLTVSAQPGPFTGAVNFSATGLPTGTSLAFSPPQVVPGIGAAVVTVTMQTAAPQTAYDGGQRRTGITLLTVTVFGLIGMRRRSGVLRALCVFSAAMIFTGCGARSVGESLGGVVSQSYPLQITGTATNLAGAVVTHAVALTLTVQGTSP